MTDPGDGGAQAGGVDPFEILMPLVTAATVRIHAPLHGYAPGRSAVAGGDRVAPRPWGSGFFVAPNWVLTCAHVALRDEARAEGGTMAAATATAGATERRVGVSFGGRTVTGVVEWAQPDASPGRGPWPAPDLALIRLLEPVSHPCVWLTERTSKVFTRKEVAFFGCTLADGEVEDFSGRCTIRGELGSNGKLRLGNEDEMPEGVSGGPVVDLARGEVIGVLKARRTGTDGGLAVSVVQLRRLPLPGRPVRGEADDLYQRVLHAHDRYHADRHRDVHFERDTWTDAHIDIGATAGRALNPGKRVQLLGLLAELPPPVSTNSLERIVRDLHGRAHEGLPLAPRGWRDGLGLLYDTGRASGELETVLRYAVHAATADRPYPATGDAERHLWEWAEECAAEAGLPRLFRNSLAGERVTRLRTRKAAAVPAVPRPPAASQQSVLLEIIPRGWEPGRYDWRVCVDGGPGELEPIEEDFRGTRLEDLPRRLSGPLGEAFRRRDEPDRRAVLQVALPEALLGLPVDEWRIPPEERPLGVARPVVLRGTDWPAARSPAELDARRNRWYRAHRKPGRPVLLDCDEGWPEPVPPPGELGELPEDTLPVLCRAAAEDTRTVALRRIVGSGYGIALWRRVRVEHNGGCADFHRGVVQTLSAVGGAGELPTIIWGLRADTGAGVPEVYWSKGMALLYDDPNRPLPGADQPLAAP